MPVAITNPSHYSNSSSSAVSVAASVLFQPKNLHQSHNQDASETVAILSNHLFHQLKSAASSSSSSESLSLTIAINLKRPNKDGIKNLVLKARNQLEGEIGQVAADAVQEVRTDRERREEDFREVVLAARRRAEKANYLREVYPGSWLFYE